MKKIREQIVKDKLDEEIGLELIRTALKNQKRVKLTFRGNSMEPSIKDGEKVIFERVSPDQIKIGEIILFNKTGALIGHRVLWKVKLEKIYFLTKGDNSNFTDRPIHAETIYGRICPYNKITYNKINFRSKVVFLLDIFLSKIENALLKDFKIFRGNILSRILS